MTDVEKDLQKMTEMCKQLMWLADRMTKEPFYIIAPSISIIKNNLNLIAKYDLNEMIKE